MMSLVTQPFDLSPTHDIAAFAIFPPGSALRAVARERAHELLAVGHGTRSRERALRRSRPRTLPREHTAGNKTLRLDLRSEFCLYTAQQKTNASGQRSSTPHSTACMQRARLR